MTVYGGDFSDYQATIPDGLDFYLFKCTEGNHYVSKTYHARMSAINGASIKGAYHFFRMSAPVDSQIAWFSSHANIGSGDLVVLDLEDVSYDSWSGYQDHEVIAAAANLMNELIALYPNNRVLLYCNHSTLDRYVRHGIPVGDGLWIADPSGRPDYTQWVLWQYTSQPYDRNLSDTFADATAMRDWAHDKNSAPAIVPFLPPPSPESDTMTYLEPGDNMHDDIIVAGKGRLVMGVGYGDHSVIHSIDFWGSNESGFNPVRIGVGGHVDEFTLNPDEPLYMVMPAGAIVASVRWTSDHRIAAGAV